MNVILKGRRQHSGGVGAEPQADGLAEGRGAAEAADGDEPPGRAAPHGRDGAPAAAGADVAGGAGAEGEADHGPAAVSFLLFSHRDETAP
jgi:hypothetical protein